MRKKLTSLLLATLLTVHFSFSQSVQDLVVQLTATTQASPPQITLNWLSDAGATSYQVYKKKKSDSNFSLLQSGLSSTATQFVDTAVQLGESYEYFVKKFISPYDGYGYINTGINVPELDLKGVMILVVDTMYAANLATEIAELEDDIEKDGWKVERIDVDRTDLVPAVKARIVAAYNKDPQNTHGVYLLGHVPVPYSGNLVPDGHTNNHYGAWPADGYYGEIDGTWTDVSVNNTTAPARTQNVPGDGKFDQTIFPSPVELQVGRVDFYNMTTFSETEEELLRRYLNKAHQYKHKQITAVNRAIIDDNFGYFSGEAFASNGWRNFAPLAGSDSLKAGDYFTNMKQRSYLWSFGCGGGSYTSCSGVGNTANFASDSLQSIFTILFGSYFGDFDSQNNLLRAALANGSTLTNFWAGRPNWQIHHMGMGENIGYSARITMNNYIYYASVYPRYIHSALMGDPTLRAYMITPPSNLTINNIGGFTAQLSWTASPDNVDGYNIYMKNDSNDNYVKLNSALITGTTYSYNQYLKGNYTYMVRAVRLDTTPSGTFHNISLGAWNTTFSTAVNERDFALAFDVYPNPSKGLVTLDIASDEYENYAVTITDISGKVLMNHTSTTGRNTLDLNHFAKGTYFITVATPAGKQSVKKIVLY
jgi:hypothetical protein